MASPSLTIRIGADASGATREINHVTQNIQTLGSQVNNTTNNVNNYNTVINHTANNSNSAANATRNLSGAVGGLHSGLQSVIGLVGGGMLFKNAIQEIATFETKMLSLKALTMANTEQMKAMEVQSRELGATTAFTAQQAAEAQGVLASTGLKANEILRATPQILKLAAAGNLDLAKAAEISMASMKGLGLGLSDLGHINDVFARVAADSAINVEQVGLAMGEAAPTARAFGVSLETVSAAIGILKDNGMKVGSIGDGIKAFMNALSNETKENIAILNQHRIGLDRHNMSYKDLNVSVLGINKVLENFKEANFSANDAIKLFGSEAFNVGIVLSNNVDALEKNGAAYVKTSGDAQIMADILNQGLSKAWDALKGSLTEASLQMGDVKSGGDSLTSGLTELIQTITGVISIYEGMGEKFAESNKLTAESYENIKRLSSELRGIGGAVGGIIAVTGAIWAAQKAVVALNFAVGMNPLVRLGMVAGAATGYVQQSLADNQSTIDKQIETSEKRIAAMRSGGWQGAIANAANKIGLADGFDEAKERAKITALKQYKEEQAKGAKDKLAQTAAQDAADKAADKSKQSAEDARRNSATSYQKPDESAAKAARKAETDAAREAKKEQEGYKRLIESTPIGEYNAKVAELSNALKKGGVDQQTYNDLMVEAAAKYEKSTTGIDKMTAAEKERQRVFEGTARGKFEKSTDELRKARPNMSEAEYANKQDKIGVDYLHESGQNKDAKTQIDLATEAQKAFKDELSKTAEVFDSVGNSGKMAFDGILGGISAVASSFTDFGKSIEYIDKKWADYGANYSKLMEMEGATQEQKNALTTKYYKEKQAYESASFQSEISGARSIAGATSKMFSEKSAGRKAFHAIEMGMGMIEMAFAAKKMIVDVAAGAANMFSQGGFAGFAGVAAMAAVMGGLGFAMSGGSSKEAVLPEHTKTTGTILGNSEAQSHSVDNIVSKLDEIHASEYPELRNIVSAVNDLKTAQNNMIASIFKAGGVKMASITQPNNDNSGKMMALSGIASAANGVMAGFGVASAVGGLVGSGMAAGIGMALGAATAGVGLVVSAAIWALSKVPVIGDIINGITSFISNGLFGKKTSKVVDGGININAQSMGGVIDSGSIDGAVSTIVDTKKSSWFKTSHKISEILTELDDSVKSGLGKVFSSMAVAVGSFWDFISGDVNKGLEKIRSFTIPFANIKTFGLKEEDVQKAFEDYSSMTFDNLVKHVFGGFVTQFQAMGESLADTMNRLITDTVQVKSAFTKMGADMSQTNDHLIIFSESMIGMAGGLKNLITLADNFTNKFTSKDVKNRLSEKDIRAFASDAKNIDVLKSQGLDMSDINKVLSAIDNKGITAADVNALKDSIGTFGSTLATKASELSAKSDKYSLPDAASAYDKAFNSKTEKSGSLDLDVFAGNAAWKAVGNNDWYKQTWGSINQTFVENIKAGNNAWYTEMRRVLDANTLSINEGVSELIAQGLPTDKKTFDANKSAESAIAKPVEALTVTALQLTDALGTVTDNLMNYAKIVEATANITKTAGENINATRANEIAGLSTQNEKDAKAIYNTTFDTKKWIDDTLAGEQRIYDLRHTAAEVSIAALNRNVEKIKNEATATDTLNGYTQKRIDLLKQEYAATQFSAYDKKLRELKTGVLNLGLAMTDTDVIINNLKLSIQDLRDSYVEIPDLAGNVINPINQLINELIDTQVATSLKANADALKNFGKTVKDWATGMKISSVGNAASQLAVAQADFDSKYGIITDKTSTNSQKSDAMSSIASSASTLIDTLRKQGTTGDWANNGVNSVISQMEGLPQIATMQDLMLDALKESNGILTTVADNTGVIAGKDAPLSDTKALTLTEALDASIKISETATNTKSTAEALGEIKGSQSDLSNKIDGIDVNFSEIKTAPIEIKPISLSLDTTGISGILNSQLTVLNSIRDAVNGGGLASNDSSGGGNNVVNITVGGGSFGGGTVTPTVAGVAGSAPITPAATTKPHFSGEKTPQSIGIAEYFADQEAAKVVNTPTATAPAPVINITQTINQAAANDSGLKKPSAAKTGKDIASYFPGGVLGMRHSQSAEEFAFSMYASDHPELSGSALASAFSDEIGAHLQGLPENQDVANTFGTQSTQSTQSTTFTPNLNTGNNQPAPVTPIPQTNEPAPAAKPLFGNSLSGVPTMHTAETGFFRTPEQDDFARTYGKTNANARSPYNNMSAYELAESLQSGLQGRSSNNGVQLLDLAEDAKKASGTEYFSSTLKEFLNSTLTKAELGFFSLGSTLHSELSEAKRLKLFAKGGVSNEPAIFGEAGWEAAVPLPDGRSIPVTINQAPAQKQDNGELIAVLTDGFDALIERIEQLERATVHAQNKTTVATAKNGDNFHTQQTASILK